jgi:hypothetical protein
VQGTVWGGDATIELRAFEQFSRLVILPGQWISASIMFSGPFCCKDQGAE